MYRQATDVAATAGGEEDYVDGMLLQATGGTPTAGPNRRCCGMQLQATSEVAATAEESGPALNAAVGMTSWQPPPAGAAEDDVECRCRLPMWKQQQEQQKMIWDVGAGF